MAISLKDKIATLSPDKIAKNRAMGGELRLVAEFPNRQPFVLRGLVSMRNEITPNKANKNQTPSHENA